RTAPLSRALGAQIPLLLAFDRRPPPSHQALRPRLEPPPTAPAGLPALCLPRHGFRVPMTLATPAHNSYCQGSKQAVRTPQRSENALGEYWSGCEVALQRIVSATVLT